MFTPVDPKVNFPRLEERILEFWQRNAIFTRSVERAPKAGLPNDGLFVFYEGPPTANARPGIHHVLSRVFKDLIPRYKTMQGYRVPRKAGWDTHGLPVELEIERSWASSPSRRSRPTGSPPSTRSARRASAATSRSGPVLANGSPTGATSRTRT